MRPRRLVLWAGGAAALVAGFAWAFWPEPILVDAASVRRGPMTVSVAAEGVTRVREPFLVTAPLAGTTRRSSVEVGDTVVGGQTVLAVIEPAEPAFLDARARAQAEAALSEAIAAVHLAAANVARAEADLAHSAAELERSRALAERGVISRRTLEDAGQRVEAHRAALQASQSELAMREATRERARAQLVAPRAQVPEDRGCCVEVLAPQSGTVLAVENVSARLVQAGEPLVTIGDLADLEIEVDLLSADAVALAPGAPAVIERWGGPNPLVAEVRRIDPRGRARVSALGIEEQRVTVHLVFLGDKASRPGLGDGYRVFARIVTWESEDALQVPVSALFRAGGDWAVYRIEGDAAHARTVRIGRRSDTMAEVLAGLEEGDRIVVYPGDRLSEGVRVALRPGAGDDGVVED
jgi:HlyD family secretion protein